ncbi:MAG: hypothetical protein IPK16_33550 [Anaerolineales bacterium]|nr:hypothetical protein [Anaerolineales bacterium]
MRFPDFTLIQKRREYEITLRILVTGAGGFAGSHLVEYLLTTVAPAAEIHGVIWQSMAH